MNRLFLPVAALLFMAACTSEPNADKAVVADAQAVTTPASGNAYKADLNQSTVDWTGTKPTGRHTGQFKLQDGSIMADATGITGGEFVIDINSMRITDADTEGTSKLRGHLLSSDFFHADSADYKTAKFQITAVKAGTDTTGDKKILMKDATHTITGNLTLKGVSKSVTFPARVAMTDASITTDADFNIDRSQWNMSYGADKSLGNKMINSDVNIKLHIVANK